MKKEIQELRDREAKIKELRNKISYWIEKSKTLHSQVEKGLLADKILEARKEIGRLENKGLDRIKRVDIIDAPPIADRLELEKKRSRSGVIAGGTSTNANFSTM